MKIIDRYLVKQFLQTFIFGILAFTLIFVVIDMMENLDDFIDQNVSVDIVAHYYFVFSPEIIRLITPVSVLFAALFTASKSANLSELTAIKASGVSLYRFMAPFLITTFFISALSVYFSGYLVPMANKTKVNIEQTYLKKGIVYAGSNIFFQDSKTRIINIQYFDDSRNTANKISIQEFSANNPTQMVSRIDAEKMYWDSTKKDWQAIIGSKRTFKEDSQDAFYFDTLNLNYLSVHPKDILSKQQKPEEMNLTELKELSMTQQRSGNDPTNVLIEYHSRFAFAFSSLIVVIFGLPISANKRKGGLAVQVGFNIFVTFIYLVFMKVSQAFGKNGTIEPIVTAWMANMIFLAAALINLPRIKQ
ncbi:MAG: LptF/LptG family permease [Syntrophothermus sp.]